MEKIWYLKKIDIFEDMKDDEYKKIDEHSFMKEYPKDHIIYSQNDESNYIYFLKSGKVRLYRLIESGKQITLTILTAGDTFGGLLGSQQSRYNEFAEVIEDALICSSQVKVFFEIIKNNPTVNLKLNKLLGLRVYELEVLLEELLFKTVLERTASLLYRLHDKYITPVLNNPKKKDRITLSHNDLANMIGATREATTIALNKLKHANLIELTRNNILIKNQEKLKNFKEM